MNLFVLILFVFLTVTNACNYENFQFEANIKCGKKYDLQGYFIISRNNNDNGYSYTISPEPVIDTNNINVLRYSIESGVNYTLKWQHNLDSTCDGNKSFYVPNPSFVISQPKCRYSQGSATFIKPVVPENFFYDHNCKDEPCTLSYGVGVRLSYTDDIIGCYYVPPVYELSTKFPNFKLQDTYVYKNSGLVQLYDMEHYSNWTLVLKDTPEQAIAQTSSGRWEGLSAKEYYLLLESEECGKQVIPFFIQTTWPAIRLQISKNETCPRNSTFSLVSDDPDMYDLGVQVYLDAKLVEKGQAVYVANTRTRIKYRLVYQDYAPFENSFETITMLGDVQYRIDNCGDVTLYYNETLYTDIEVKDDVGNRIAVIDKQFYNSDYFTIESPCHFTSMNVILNPPLVPSVTISREQQFCGDTIDLYVANYYEFSELVIGNEKIQHDNGYFKNISLNNRNINFKYGCYKAQQYYFDIESYSNYSDYQFDIEIIRYPVCTFPGNVSYTLTDIKSNQRVTIYYPFSPSSQEYFIARIEACGEDITKPWIAPSKDEYYNNFPLLITTVNATCKYSMDGEIKIKKDPSLSITKLYIDSVEYSPDSSSSDFWIFMSIPYGQHFVTISSNECSDFYETISIGTNLEWSFPAQVTPVTGDCSISNGAISYDTSIFNSVSNVQEFSAVASGYHYIDFVLQNNTCSGVARVYVPTSNQISSFAKASIISEQTCDNAKDAVVQLSVVDKNGNLYKPTNATLNGLEVNSYIQLIQGDYNFIVYNQSCSWPVSVSLKSRDPQFDINLVNEMIDSCSQYAAISVIPKDKNITINEITSSNLLSKFSDNMYSFGGGKRNTLWINYNEGCVKAITLEFTDSVDLFSKIEWSILSAPSVDCSDPSVQSITSKIEGPGSSRVILGGSIPASKIYFPTYKLADYYYSVFDLSSGCSNVLHMNNDNMVTIPKTIKKPTCPGSIDGTLQIDLDPKKSFWNVFSSVDINQENRYSNLTTGEWEILSSFHNNLFCINKDRVEVIVEEPSVILSSIGICDAQDTPIGETGLVRNTLSLKTSNVTYTINGITQTDPTFRGLSIGDYTSIVNINNTVCKRVIHSNTVSVSTIPTVSVYVDTSSCMKAIINPNSATIQHKYTVVDSVDRLVHSSESIGSFTFTAQYPDTYSIVITDTETCSYKTSFTINECPTPPPTSSKDSSSSIETPSSSFKLQQPSLYLLICIIMILLF